MSTKIEWVTNLIAGNGWRVPRDINPREYKPDYKPSNDFGWEAE